MNKTKIDGLVVSLSQNIQTNLEIINSTNPTKDFSDVKQYIINYYNLCQIWYLKYNTKTIFQNIYNSMLRHSYGTSFNENK